MELQMKAQINLFEPVLKPAYRLMTVTRGQRRAVKSDETDWPYLWKLTQVKAYWKPCGRLGHYWIEDKLQPATKI
jgi:hypothetical protein